MSKLPFTLISTALVVMLAVASAQAQPRGSRGQGMMQPGGGGMLGLLHFEKVQTELALTDEQKAQLKEVTQGIQGVEQIERSELSTLNPEERRAKIQEMRKEAHEKMAEAQKRVAEILKPDQFERLTQIWIQREGVAALGDPEIAQALGLTKEQKEKLVAIHEGAREQLSPATTREERLEKMKQVRKEVEEKAEQVLTQEQRDKLEQLKGKKFDVDFSTLRPQRRGSTTPAGEDTAK